MSRIVILAEAGASSNVLRSDDRDQTRTFAVATAWKRRRARVGAARRRDDGFRGLPMTITIAHYLVVAACLFTIGILGIFLNRKNVIVILMSIELMLLAVNINFVAFSSFLGDLTGQVFALFILTVAAAEAAIGLAIIVVYFRNRGSIAVEDINMMKG
jgi:NADH-quinone oxidoreductase subunit K